jgi:hypothetical protein
MESRSTLVVSRDHVKDGGLFFSRIGWWEWVGKDSRVKVV